MFSRTWRSVVLVTGETTLLCAAVLVSSLLLVGPHLWDLLAHDNGILRVVLIVFVCQVCLHYGDLYDLRTIVGTRDLAVRLVRAIGATSLILGVAYWLFPRWVIERGVFLLSAVLAVALVISWRYAFEWVTRHLSPRERLLLVGTGPAAVVLARELFERRQELGVDIVGFVDPDPNRVGAPVINPGVIGAIEDIPQLAARLHVDRVVVSLSDERGKLPMGQLLDVKLRSGVSFDHLASVYEEYTGKIALENLRPSWLIFSAGFRKAPLLMAVKRAFDVFAAAMGLLLASPLMLLTAIIVKLESPRDPVLYHQVRVGLNGQPFTIHKFRTMRSDAEASTGPVWSRANDTRVTSVGRFMRKTRLDELPQLWNILLGDMSLIGPRPERPSFVEQLTAQIPFYGQRHVIKPGLTGWAQVRYSYGASVEDAIEKMQYDLYYVKNLSIMLDFVIVLETIKTVVLRRGGAMTDIINAMSVDVEDYFQVSAFERVVSRADWNSYESRVVPNTHRLLEFFDRAGVRATFFVLGWVAKRFPSLVSEIANFGHELASHGFNHQLVYGLTPDQFREDVRSAKAVIEDAGGREVRGYRAPSFSIVKSNLWALDILIEQGYGYDASIFPIRHDRYGIPDAERHPHRVTRLSGSIVEVPGSTVRVGGTNLPVAGGGYFRLLPYAWTRWGIGRANRVDQEAVTFYLHPWEIDPDQPRLPAGRVTRLRHYAGLESTLDRLGMLVRDFRFDSIESLLKRRPQLAATPRTELLHAVK